MTDAQLAAIMGNISTASGNVVTQLQYTQNHIDALIAAVVGIGLAIILAVTWKG